MFAGGILRQDILDEESASDHLEKASVEGTLYLTRVPTNEADKLYYYVTYLTFKGDKEVLKPNGPTSWTRRITQTSACATMCRHLS